MHDKKITEYWLPWITKIMNQHIQGSGLQDAKKKKDSWKESKQLPVGGR